MRRKRHIVQREKRAVRFQRLILENINLRDVEAGIYELLAAPVNLQGVDGAWTRALLRRD